MHCIEDLQLGGEEEDNQNPGADPQQALITRIERMETE